LLLELRMDIQKDLLKFDGLCFEGADEGWMGMDGLNCVRLMQLTVMGP
jgi:hypothetical protein